MLKKSIIVLGLGVLAVTSLQTAAMAGGHGYGYGYDPLWWNAPSGSSQSDLFKKNKKYKTTSHSYSGCSSYKKKYLKTGKKYWLRKYEVCKVEQN